MDLDFINPPSFSVGQELGSLIATCGILTKAWEGICSISNNKGDSFLLVKDEDVAYVIFPSFHNEDFIVTDSKYGECNIQNDKIFSAGLKGDDDNPALVHKGALNRFRQFLENQDFKAKVEGLKEQAIIFVGHSIGGAVAALATLWFLEKRLRNSNSFCITFGAPLFGNAIIREALGCEDWLGRFCHVVCKYDIVPRMNLAPYESTAKPLDAIVPHWWSKMGIDCAAVSHFSISEACMALVNSVLKCTSTIANNYPGESGLRSPFVPIGTYMFCSTHDAACFEDSEAVLKLLHFSMQSQDGIPFDQIAGICISEHTDYGHMLEDIDGALLNARQFANFVSNSSFEIGIALELEAIGVGAQQDNHALFALRKAGEEKNEKDRNIEKLNVELSTNQSSMAELEWYKMRCKNNNIGYYDAFKQLVEKKDFKVNLHRKKLESFWDEIVDKEKKHVLPSDFRTRNKWINAGTAYRRLVEPLDIAYHYHTDKGHKSYLSDGVRPHRHIVLEKWMKEKEQTRTGGNRGRRGRTNFASLTQDSCFWAHLEEACKALVNLQQEQDINASLQVCVEFEKYVGSMITDKSISLEVFLDQSSFMIWWQQYSDFQSPQWKSSSSVFDFMAKEGWKKKV
ncbi:lipase-like PAD4 isoform X2 [Cryptomeria japonica]|uniref:lipase-like PAD4 isoform X2 n=1 Tax=Cryptomeria japonica TaxID=3369 RepID=UPI0025AB6736|nr:lipase-like PAD4 isoform X2 [Cryptomeria japonica]